MVEGWNVDRTPRVAGSEALQSIQMLRAVAALAVLFYHITLEFRVRLGLGDVVPLFHIGSAGVDLFFVISGFIMVHASEKLFGRREGPLIFIQRRLARIVPLYWATSIGVLLARTR